MSINSKIPLSFGFMLATVSAAAAMSHPGNIRPSQTATAYAHTPSPQQPALRISADEQRWANHQDLGLSYGYSFVR